MHRWLCVVLFGMSACAQRSPVRAPAEPVAAQSVSDRTIDDARSSAGDSVERPATPYVEGPGVSPTKGEVIEIRPRQPTVTRARRSKFRRTVPPYSGEAASTNRWARAWLLLDIDERGVVTRLKFLNRPGYNLDQIAIDEAFGLRYQPALDKDGIPTATLMIHLIEWPSYWWLIDRAGLVTWKYPRFAYIPCRDSGAPLNQDMIRPIYRDCSRPDLSRLRSAPWIDPPRLAGERSNMR